MILGGIAETEPQDRERIRASDGICEYSRQLASGHAIGKTRPPGAKDGVW
jgi:hypothetical protein